MTKMFMDGHVAGAAAANIHDGASALRSQPVQLSLRIFARLLRALDLTRSRQAALEIKHEKSDRNHANRQRADGVRYGLRDWLLLMS